MTSENKRVGVALSGGGYRAAAFHLGVLNKLHELGVLQQTDVFSTISGGSITGAAWAISENDYPDFHSTMKKKLQERGALKYIFLSYQFWLAVIILVGLPLISILFTFTSQPFPGFSFFGFLIFFCIIFFFQFDIFPVSNMLESAYNEIFFGGKKIKDLRDDRIIVIGATNLHTGRPFTFSKKKMGDSLYTNSNESEGNIVFKQDEFPIARAVMASSSVPFAFTPVKIHRKFFTDPASYDKIKPVLVDGGVYDNQGIHKLTHKKSSYFCDIVIVSDAGGNVFAKQLNYKNTFSLLLRTADLFMRRIKSMQMIQQVFQNTKSHNRPIAYFSLAWDIDSCIDRFFESFKNGLITEEVINLHGISNEWVSTPEKYKNEIIGFMKGKTLYTEVMERNLKPEELLVVRSIGTNLTRLKKKKVDLLIAHAQNLTEMHVRLYCPMLL